MSSDESTATIEPKSRLLLRIAAGIVSAMLLSPMLAAHGYLLTQTAEDAFDEDEVDDRIRYLAEKQAERAAEIEIDLGSFNTSIVRSEINKVLRVRFQLVGVISEKDQDIVEELQETKLHRFRDQVISELTRTEAANLADPRLVELQAQLMNLANQLTGEPIFRDLILNDFSILQQ